jgi:dihydroorotate dehydrogenase electron transfer subunit
VELTVTPTTVLAERTELGSGLLLRVQGPRDLLACRPGQFLMLRCGPAWTPYLRRSLFPVEMREDSLALWINSLADEGLAWLSRRKVGDSLDLIGPLGKGFLVQPQQRRLLLVAEAAHVAPLLALMQLQLARQGSVVLLLQGQTVTDLLPPGTLPPSVEYYTATADGSAGDADALDTLLVGALPWADALATAGSIAFLRRLQRRLEEVRPQPYRGFAQAVAPVPLPCGAGACLACLVDTGRGHHRACQRGPVFDLAELAL